LIRFDKLAFTRMGFFGENSCAAGRSIAGTSPSGKSTARYPIYELICPTSQFVAPTASTSSLRAKRSNPLRSGKKEWIASVAPLLAMTGTAKLRVLTPTHPVLVCD
jgi:hypothetical protein